MRLYLDVDGVVNASYAQRAWHYMASGSAKSDSGTYLIRWAPAMVWALSELPLNLVWATTWTLAAVEEIAPLIGWGQHGGILTPLGGELYWPSIEWKFDSMQEIHNPEDRFVWIDDELRGRHRTEFPNALLINPDPTFGIQPKHIEQIKEYIG